MSDDLAPHYYSPDYQAMGDCRVCGNVQDSWPHWSSGARSEIARLTAERDAEREARKRLADFIARLAVIDIEDLSPGACEDTLAGIIRDAAAIHGRQSMSDDTPAELAAGADALLVELLREGEEPMPTAADRIEAQAAEIAELLGMNSDRNDIEQERDECRNAMKFYAAEAKRLTAERDALAERLRNAEEALRKIKAGEWHIHDGEEYVILLSAERCRDIAVAALGGSA
jgi:hypothetical protein